VTKTDVNKFLAESGREVFTYRKLIATTDLIDRIGQRTIQIRRSGSHSFDSTIFAQPMSSGPLPRETSVQVDPMSRLAHARTSEKP
jgi:hypothetical protein